jgi:sulfate transport system permease protein
VTDARVLAALKLSFGASLIAATVNAFFGLLIAWVLIRYRFPGRRLLDALIDLPFACRPRSPALRSRRSTRQWLVGGPLKQFFGLQVGYTPLGVMIALTSSACPSSCAPLQPVLQDLEREQRRPPPRSARAPGRPSCSSSCRPPAGLVTGFALAFAAPSANTARSSSSPATADE